MGNKLKLGRLEEVEIRELWKHEQYDFSEWLSKEENIEMLSDEIGLTLTEINKEVFVGSYRCDLVAKDETTGIKVIIENKDRDTILSKLGCTEDELKSLMTKYYIDEYMKGGNN